MRIIFKYIIRPFIILLFVVVSFNATAQGPPPPPGGGTGDDNTWGNSLSGSAPIGNELVIFLILGAAYGGKKLYDFTKAKKEIPDL